MKNYYIYIIAIAAIVWAILATKGCNDKSGELSQLDAYNQSLKDSTVKSFTAKDGLVTTYKNQIEADENVIQEVVNENVSLKKTLSDMKVKVKDIQYVTQIETKTKLVHDTIKLRDSLKQGDNQVSFSDSNKNYNIQGFVNDKQLIFTQLSFLDSVTMVSEMHGGFLRHESYILKISHTDPYITTTGIQSLILKPQKKWYQTTLIKLGIGAIGGVILDRTLLK